MKYSEGFKAQAVAKGLDSHGRSINEVAADLNVYPATLSNWIKQAKEGKLGQIEGDSIPPSQRHPGEKFSLLLESKSIPAEQLGEWLRKQGLHSEHLPLWEQELGDFMKNKNTDLKSENNDLKRQNKELQKELARKEKALAEVAVLLTLKKKIPESVHAGRGELTTPEERTEILAFVDEAKAKDVSERSVCRLIGLNRKTIHSWRREGLKDRRKGSARCVPHRLSEAEEEAVLAVCNSAKYCDMPPAMIVALLAQEKTYIASESTFYRVLRKNQLLTHRQQSKAPRKGKRPDRIEVTGPNQVWSWDITWLKTEVKGLFYYAYTIIDVYDRSIVGWTIEDQESDHYAHRLFSRIIRDLKVKPEVIHADNGNPMRGMTLAAFLDSLFITRSYSRPRVSNDNAFIESWHKTLKYSVGYPDFFPSIDQARVWYANFINWYNTEHLHSALGYVTPEQHRSGESGELYTKRNETLLLARSAKPDRWRNGKVKEYGSSPVKTVYRPLSKTA